MLWIVLGIFQHSRFPAPQGEEVKGNEAVLSSLSQFDLWELLSILRARCRGIEGFVFLVFDNVNNILLLGGFTLLMAYQPKDKLRSSFLPRHTLSNAVLCLKKKNIARKVANKSKCHPLHSYGFKKSLVGFLFIQSLNYWIERFKKLPKKVTVSQCDLVLLTEFPTSKHSYTFKNHRTKFLYLAMSVERFPKNLKFLKHLCKPNMLSTSFRS